MKNTIQKLAVVIPAMIITAMGASLGIKAAVGVGAWDALSISVCQVIGLKVGTFSMIMNITCVAIQLVILKKDFKIVHASQVLVSVMLGGVVNFMIYNVFARFTITSYAINLGLLLLSVIICSIAISVIMTVNLVTFPLESCCMVIANKLNKNFGTLRQMVDVAAIVISLGLSLAFADPIQVREGTVIAMILFGPLLNLIMPRLQPGMEKLNLTVQSAN
ncbi:MAG: hypothetical protein PHI41_10445 [Erysipelotrichaceae bacterium]|nr:hypothetical protein [Erysipelotrichaceae bacterium]